jgi:diguanylate cyclase (GGDEF)-like protein/PAS domain S-box-containing protein
MAGGKGRRVFDERDAARVLQGLPDGLVVLEQDATIVWVNARFRELTGWTDEELVGRNGLELLDPDQLADAFEAFTITTEQEMLPEGSYALAQREGGFVEYQMHAATIDPSKPDSLVALLVRPVDHRVMINDGIERLNAGGPISDMADFVVHRIGWDAGQVAVVFDDDADHSRRSVHAGLPAALDGTRAADDGLAPWDEAVATGEAVHRHVDELPGSIAAAAKAHGFGACTAEPVPDASGRDAVILLWFDAGAPATYRFLFREEPRYLLLRLALERRHHLRALRNAATNDHLTGLANRHHFFDAVDRLSADAPCAVLYIDLDDFKPINDTLGHLMGDAVLREIGMRLRESVRAGDVAARLGGDEFAILCCDDATEDAISALASRVHAAITRPIEMPEGAVRVGASVGAAVAAKAGIPAAQLIEAADRALYEHKRLGKDGCRTVLVT